jgi:hypothetical protein
MPEQLAMNALVYDGVMARAYLAHLRANGFLLEQILFVRKRRGANALWPRGLYRWYANRAQAAAAMYWVRQLPNLHPQLHEAMTNEIVRCHDLPDDFYASLTSRFDYAGFARNLIEVEADGLRDPALKAAFDALPAYPVLFTGGGIMPDALVSDPRRPVLHVHPGVLPAIRGADGLLWSTAVLGHPTASCFLMSNGLDTGAVIATAKFPALTFSAKAEKRPDSKSLYRLLYAYYDPILRAKLLTDVIKRSAAQGLASAIAHATPQDLTQGRTYNFMHSTLRNAVMERIFPSAA